MGWRVTCLEQLWVFFFLLFKVYFVHTQALDSEEWWQFICRLESTLSSPNMLIWGLSALGSIWTLSLSNHPPSSQSSSRMLCACMYTGNQVFRPQKALLWYSQPDHIPRCFADSQSISTLCRQNMKQLLLLADLWAERIWDHCISFAE